MMFVLYRTLLRGVSSRARIGGFLAIGLVEIGVAMVIANQALDDPVKIAAELVDKFGLTLVIPLAALVFGTACLGDPIEDGTYVYLWLRPVQRWRVTVAAYLATLSLVIPLAVVPTVISGALIDSSVAVAALVASLIAAIAYSAVFVLLGQVTQRSLIWGVAYLLILEQFISRGGKGLGFISVHSHAVSVLAKLADRRIVLDYFSLPVAVIVPLLFTAGWIVFSSTYQRRMSVM